MKKGRGEGRFGGLNRLPGILRDKRGAFAMQFALMVIPLVLCVGLAIDGGRVFLARFNLMSALDAAALAMGSTTDNTVDLNAMAELYVAQNFRMPDTGPVALTSDPSTIVPTTETITLRGTVAVSTYFMPLAGISSVNVSAESVVKRGGADVEVAIVLDTTGSMAGTRIEDLKDAAQELVGIVVNDTQTPYYSKVAIAPYANSVYLGGKADTVRGAVPAAKNITSAAKVISGGATITGVTKENKAEITAPGHGFSNYDVVYIYGVNGMTQINGGPYEVRNKTSNKFELKYTGSSGSGWVNSNGWSNYTSGGKVTDCSSGCDVQITSAGHGFSNNDWIWITNATGSLGINNSSNTAWQIANVTANTFTLKNSDGLSGTYTGNGKAWCTTNGCQYYRFQNASSSWRVYEISQCVTERIGSEQYTDASYATKGVGYHYPGSGSNLGCYTNNDVVPLTANKTFLNSEIENLTTNGSTAGHIGLAWGYYLLSDNWNGLWDNASQHAGPMDAKDLVKAVVMMTDGEFNTGYCNGVLADDASFSSNSSQINCNANNGDFYDQAEALCDSIKADDIHLYTVGFGISAGSTEDTFLSGCASSNENYYLASDGAELTAAFKSIAKSISLLRLAQ